MAQLGDPDPSSPSVFTIGSRRSPSPNICSARLDSIRSPSDQRPRSILLTTKSAISMCRPSGLHVVPRPGTSTDDPSAVRTIDCVLADADGFDPEALAGGVRTSAARRWRA
jgi:hypothetical protein